jgi:hypothetical protein
VARAEAPARSRIAAGGAAVAAVLALAIWLPLGPLASGWARRAGTPRSVLTAFSPPARAPAAANAPPAPRPDRLRRRFSAALIGRIHNGIGSDGSAVADLRMRLQGGPRSVLRIRLGGEPIPGGGLRMARSAVTLGPPGDPARYSGRVEVLDAAGMRSLVGSADGKAVRLEIALSLQGGTVSGRVRGTPVGG